MLMPVQTQSILYHFLMGWVYGLGFSFLLNFVKYVHVSFLRGTMEILFHVLFTSLLYYGLYGINGGITNIYLLGFFLLGVMVYYTWYLAVFQQFFFALVKTLRPLRKKLKLVKSKILAIIRLPKKIRRRRINERRSKKNKRKKKKEETSISHVL